MYEKTVNFGSMPNATSKQVAHRITNLKYIVDMRGIMIRSTDYVTKPIPFLNPSSANASLSLEMLPESIYIATISANYSGYTGYITLRYIKTSS